MEIHGFRAWRPEPQSAHTVASVPYDTVNIEEARALCAGNPNSFLHVVRPEIDLPEGTPATDAAVYAAAAAAMERLLSDGVMLVDPDHAVYLYRLKMGNHTQRGIVACCNTSDYEAEKILRHEKTRQDKEDDRTRHVRSIMANTGPVFLTYQDALAVDQLVASVEETPPLYDMTASDGVEHTVWKIADVGPFAKAFDQVSSFYIADGHHRAAAAVRAAKELQAEQPGSAADEASRFLAVLFPSTQLNVLGYHRVIHDLNGMRTDAFLENVRSIFSVSSSPASVAPTQPGVAGMYIDGQWYTLSWSKPESGDPVSSLDVSILQDRLLAPVLAIDDPRTSERISFVGGIRGTAALEQAVDSGQAAVAFSMSPVTVEEVMAIADAGREMPPKSTWFEPKLRSGLLVHPFVP